MRAKLYIPSETIPPGAAVLFYGPAPASGSGALDSTRIQPGGRCLANPGHKDEWPPSGVHTGPAAQSGAGVETAAVQMVTDRLVYGDKQLAVALVDRDTGAVGAISDVVSVFIDGPPVPSARLTCQDEPDVNGCLVFDYVPGVCV